LPLSLATVRTPDSPSVLFLRVTDGTESCSFWLNERPLWLLKTRVYTCSFVNKNLPEEDGTKSTPFLSITFSTGPLAAEVVPVTFSPLVI